MLSRLLNSENTNAVLVVALSGVIAAKVASGPGSLSLRRIVSGALSNPIPKGAVGTRRSSVPAARQQVAA